MATLPTDSPALTVQEVASLMSLSRQTVERLFRQEKGTILLSRPTSNRKRRYTSIRIPRNVYERVIGGMSN